ncbi:MAG: hypothetical protein KKF43_02720, partial [Proteobacteria bacterium]|nr:hypothetical protein [Pseudomonadota bacterium]
PIKTAPAQAGKPVLPEGTFRNSQPMVRGAHPALNFGGTGFQPVHRTGKMPVPPKTFQDSHL